MQTTTNGEALALLRKAAGFSQTSFAAAVGIDRSQLWRIETGQAQPRDYTLGQFARVLAAKAGVSESEIRKAIAL